ncbi:MAG: GTPase Era [Chloroflexi bacterium]|nr:GTPase Era [Chloroflexota bacterium]
MTNEQFLNDDDLFDDEELLDDSDELLDEGDEFLEDEDELLEEDDEFQLITPLNDPETKELPEGHKSGFVAVVGRPNVGKSTLLNALLKQKIAIVSPRPQTTRLAQLGIITEPDHQIVFVDTPGILPKAAHKLDEMMFARATEALNDADIVLWLVDASTPPGEEDKALAAVVSSANGKIILAMNKNDLVPPALVLERTIAYRELVPEDVAWLFFSAERKTGLPELYQLILDNLPAGPRYYPEEQITETFVRDIAAEFIREQVLLQLRDEIPHGSAVIITQFKEEDEPLRIEATIYVEKPSHKQIVIGAGGQQLKSIGRAARKQIEGLLEKHVFLNLWVKVAPKWRQNEAQLKSFGYWQEE